MLIFILKCCILGGGTLVPKQGSVVGGKCVTTGNVASEQIHLDLKVRILILYVVDYVKTLYTNFCRVSNYPGCFEILL